MNNEFCLYVYGDYACFTRPEFKVERVSYDVITPSAARGIFQAIYWKPCVMWSITKIEILKPIKWTNIRTNELQSINSVYIEDDRTQRNSLLLKDVAYRLYAKLNITKDAPETETLKKHVEIFNRRASRGQCFQQPYFGLRQFTCYFELIEDISNIEDPINLSTDLGYMLYDFDYSNDNNINPTFFKANINCGIINVPHWNSEEVRK